MSLTAALLGGLASGVGGAAASALGSPSDATASMQSVVQGPIPPPSTPAPSTQLKPTTIGEAWDLAVEQALTGAATSVSSAAISGLESSLGLDKRAGKAYRNALGSAFPELNPWELSGSSAGGPLGSMVSSGRESAQQRSEHANQQKTVDKQLATQENIAELNSATSVANTALNNYAALEMLKYNQAESEARTESHRAGTKLTTERTISEPVTRAAAAQATKESEQRVENLKYGDTPFGKGVATGESLLGLGQELFPFASDFYDSGVDKLKGFFQGMVDRDGKSDGIPLPRGPERGQPGQPVFYKKYWQDQLRH